MKRRSILSVSATIALGVALFGITAGSTARAAEIKLLCAVALQPAMVALIPDFEKSSGHKVTIATEQRALSRTVFKRVRLPIS
jgi:molybdate transport system substrate-binding protein